ncbi:HAEPLYID family protein [Myroides sp. LJL119]
MYEIVKKIEKSLLVCLFASSAVFAQDVQEQQPKGLPDKVIHAEPLFNDLMRDLGAYKGEREWNAGFGVGDHKSYKEYFGFVEYEFAVANRLGLEVEIPFSFNKQTSLGNPSVPNNRIEGIKLASQYTFYVNKKQQLSLALAYIHEFEMNYFKNLDQGKFFTGMRMNPILIAAKNFGSFNTVVFGGPVFENHFSSRSVTTLGTLNASVLYVLPGSRNFIGIENNMDFGQGEFHYMLRPQIKVALLHNLAVGIVTGIPLTNEKDIAMDFMTRIIWEP